MSVRLKPFCGVGALRRVRKPLASRLPHPLHRALPSSFSFLTLEGSHVPGGSILSSGQSINRLEIGLEFPSRNVCNMPKQQAFYRLACPRTIDATLSRQRNLPMDSGVRNRATFALSLILAADSDTKMHRIQSVAGLPFDPIGGSMYRNKRLDHLDEESRPCCARTDRVLWKFRGWRGLSLHQAYRMQLGGPLRGPCRDEFSTSGVRVVGWNNSATES